MSDELRKETADIPPVLTEKSAAKAASLPISLLEEQTKLLGQIRDELVWKRERIQRGWWLHFFHEVFKYALIGLAVWYISVNINAAIERVQGAIPQVPTIDFSKMDPRNIWK